MSHFTPDIKVQALFENCIKGKTLVLLSGNAIPIAFQTFIKQIELNNIYLKNTIKPEFIREFLKSTEFTLQAQMMRFQTNAILSSGDQLIFPLLVNSVIEETRQAERYSFSSNEKVTAEIINPYDNETKLTKSVMDMSATGISIRTSINSNLFHPGLEIAKIKVLLDGVIYTQSSGCVIYNRQLLDHHGHLHAQVGIKFNL